jgi:hypothetical protein
MMQFVYGYSKPDSGAHSVCVTSALSIEIVPGHKLRFFIIFYTIPGIPVSIHVQDYNVGVNAY